MVRIKLLPKLYLAPLLTFKLPTSTSTHSTNTCLLQPHPKQNLHSTNTRAGQYAFHTPGTLSLHTPKLHHQPQTSRNY